MMTAYPPKVGDAAYNHRYLQAKKNNDEIKRTYRT